MPGHARQDTGGVTSFSSIQKCIEKRNVFSIHFFPLLGGVYGKIPTDESYINNIVLTIKLFIMNKKFSTLMAGLMLVGSAFSASAASGVAPTVKKGDFVQLALGSSKVIGITSGALDPNVAEVTAASVTNATTLEAATAALWQVANISYLPTTGTPFYQFVNKATGEYLAVDLKTNNKGASTAAAKLNGLGNKDWAIASDGTIYAFKGDSVYTFDAQMKLQAAKSTSVTGPTTPATVDVAASNVNVTLTPEILNAILAMPGHDGKLHFNGGKDVSTGEKNILTENEWEAYGYTDDPNYLTLVAKGKETSINKNPYVLMVDTTFYGPNNTYNKLVVDTLGWQSAANRAQFESGSLSVSGYTAGKPSFGDKSLRAIEAAVFTGTYTLGNDSISLRVMGVPKYVDDGKKYFFVKNMSVTQVATVANGAPIALTKLSNTKVLTVGYTGTITVSGSVTKGDTDPAFILPLIQPYAASASGDAVIAADKLYFVQVKNTRANTDKYWSNKLEYPSTPTTVPVGSVSAYNSADQWAVIPGATGSYQLVNRESGNVEYAGQVMKLKDADGKAVADTYVFGRDTLKLTAIDYSIAKVEGNADYTSYFYAGKDNDKVLRTFKITSASPFLSQLFMQAKSDSVAVLGEDAVVWTLETVANSTKAYSASLNGFKDLYRTQYYIAMTDLDGNKYYLYNNTDNNNNIATITLSTSGKKTAYYLKTIDKDQYVIYDEARKLTINPTPKQPIIEASVLTSERNDLFLIEQTNLGVYRELGVSIEDGLAAKASNVAKIYMDNEPNRYLYENSQNIVANNGNKVAKDSLNFLGIYNTAALVKNAALYIDTAYVDRKDNLMPQYMLALGVEDVEATKGTACTEAGPHFDKNGNKVDAAHCVHATQGTDGYRKGRYLVSVKDSIPAGSKTHPGLYDGSIRLAFVDAIHMGDSLIITDSKFTGTKNAKNDTLTIADQALNAATFALLIKDQETKSFYLETVKKGTKAQYVRILNGVPVLTDDKENAAVFNIEATEEEATANEAIEAAGVQVIGGQGVVTVQGAAGKVVTVANILGQTIANQVAASDNVTIAVPAGIVVVAVDGEATKVVVK